MNITEEIDYNFLKWEVLSDTKDDIFLKKLAKDIYENHVFTDRHITNPNSVDLNMVFMPLLFMCNYQKSESREDKLCDIHRMNYFNDIKEKTGKSEEDLRLEFFNSIGLIYEYYDKAMPRGINGYPTFMSFNLLSKGDTVKMFNFFDDYSEHIKKWNI